MPIAQSARTLPPFGHLPCLGEDRPSQSPLRGGEKISLSEVREDGEEDYANTEESSERLARRSYQVPMKGPGRPRNLGFGDENRVLGCSCVSIIRSIIPCV